MLAHVVYGFPFMDLAFHFVCIIGLTLLATRHLKLAAKPGILALTIFFATVIACALSFLTGLVRTGEYRVCWAMQDIFTTDYSLNDWRLDIIPLAIVLVFIPGVIAWFTARHFHRAWFPPPGMCTHCGYDLTGNTTGACPECGQRVAHVK